MVHYNIDAIGTRVMEDLLQQLLQQNYHRSNQRYLDSLIDSIAKDIATQLSKTESTYNSGELQALQESLSKTTNIERIHCSELYIGNIPNVVLQLV